MPPSTHATADATTDAISDTLATLPDPSVAADPQPAAGTSNEGFLSAEELWEAITTYFADGWDVWFPRLTYAVVVMVVAILLWILARVVLRFLAKHAEKTTTDWDDVIIASLRSVIGWAFLAGGAAYAVTFLEIGVLERIVHAVVILVLATPMSRIAKKIISFLEKTVASKTETKADDILFEILGRFIGFVVYAIAVIMALDHVGINVTPFIAGAGVAGVAIGFAAKDTLSNLVAGILLLLDRPFEKGDRIEVWSTPKNSATWGDVIDIGLRATKIRTTDNIIIVIPNNEIMTRDIINYTAHGDHIRVRINVGISYKTDVQKAKQILVELANELDWVADTPKPPYVVVRDFAESSVNMQLRIWIKNARKRTATISQIRDQAHSRFAAEGIEIPYPKRDIYVHQVPPKTGPTDKTTF